MIENRDENSLSLAFDSTIRTITNAVSGKEAIVFKNSAQEAMIVARAQNIPTEIAADRLLAAARLINLPANYGEDTIMSWIVSARDSIKVAPKKTAGLEVLCMADVTVKPIEWLWLNWIAIGKVSVLAGQGGVGKSTVLCDWAATTTRGGQWPDGADGTGAGSVIILAAEDDVEDTLAPRLLAAGADMFKVFNVRSVRDDNLSRRAFNLQADLVALEREIEKRADVRLVIIDPISSYLGKGVDSHKNSEVRSVLEPLGEMAARMRVAVVCNNHFSKGAGTANNRIIGSVAFVNQARSAFIVTGDADDETRLLLMPSKMNIAPIKYGLAYRINGVTLAVCGADIATSRISWEAEPVTITADQALAAHENGYESKSGKAEAIDFLKAALSSGPRAATEMKSEARDTGITDKSLRSARESLGVKLKKDGMCGGWMWELPKVPDRIEDALS